MRATSTRSPHTPRESKRLRELDEQATSQRRGARTRAGETRAQPFGEFLRQHSNIEQPEGILARPRSWPGLAVHRKFLCG